MKPERFPFVVEKTSDDSYIVAMNMGGLIRARNMPASVVRCLADACEQIRREIIPEVLSTRELSEFPEFPRCVEVAGASKYAGVTDLRVVASRDGDAVEFTTAFYDLDDPEAPALVLVDQQIDEFAARVTQVLGGSDAPQNVTGG